MIQSVPNHVGHRMLSFIYRLYVNMTLTFVSYSLSSPNECHQANDITQVAMGNFQKLLPVQEVVVYNRYKHTHTSACVCMFVCVRVCVCVCVCVCV